MSPTQAEDPVFNLQKRSTVLHNSSDKELLDLFDEAHTNSYNFVASGEYQSYYKDLKAEVLRRMDSGRIKTCEHCTSSGPEECKSCSNNTQR